MSRRRRQAQQHTLLSAGLTLLALGCVLRLVLPAMGAGRPIMNTLAGSLRAPGGFLLGLGAALLALHLLAVTLKRRQPPRADPAAARTGKDALARKPANLAAPSAAAERAADAPDPQAAAAPAAPTVWGPPVFAAIEWRRFEAVVEQLFAQAGFETRSQSHGADGGVDVWLHSRHARGPVGVVQCKHWQGTPVGVQQMREFLGVMASHGLRRGTYATTSRFTADALAFARANGINAQDGEGLLKLIATRTPEQQAALLATALQGEYWRPTCPSCGVKLADRSARKTGDRFWSCVNYPRCKYTQPMTALAQARLAAP